MRFWRYLTGDKGEFDADGFLKITGRTKEMFKTSGGKYIVPPLLEGELKKPKQILKNILLVLFLWKERKMVDINGLLNLKKNL